MAGISQPNVYPDPFSGGNGMPIYRSPLMRRGPMQPSTGIAEGIDNLTRALVPNPAAQALAEDRQAQAELRRAQLAQLTAKLTASDQAARQAADEAKDPLGTIATRLGLGPDEVAAARNKGIAPSAPETDTQPGLMGGYQGVDPATMAKINDIAVTKVLPGKTNFEQFAKGRLEQQTRDYRQAIGGEPKPGVDPTQVAAGFYATSGKAPYVEGKYGESFNPMTGKSDVMGAFPQANLGEIGARTSKEKAQAGQASAQMAKTKSETLPQTQMPLPGAPGEEPKMVPVLGKDVSKIAAGGTAVSALNDNALDMAAARYRVDGTLPTNLGRGIQGQKTTAEILNRAAMQAASEGQTGEAERIRQVSTKAAQKALANNINIAAGIDRAGNILDAHFTVLENMAKQFNPGTIQSINKAILAGRSEFNDPIANAYAQQFNTVALEYGRLKAGPNSQAMLPVEVMKIGRDAMSKGLDVPSIQAIHKVVATDVNINRQKAAEETATLQNMMRTGAAPHVTAPAAAPNSAVGTPPINLLREGQETDFKNGQTWTLRNGQAVRIK